MSFLHRNFSWPTNIKMLKCGQNMSDCKSKWQTALTNKQSLSQTDGKIQQMEGHAMRTKCRKTRKPATAGDCTSARRFNAKYLKVSEW